VRGGPRGGSGCVEWPMAGVGFPLDRGFSGHGLDPGDARPRNCADFELLKANTLHS